MEKQVQKSNLSASVGFLLTLLNLVVSSAFIITGSKVGLFIFSSVTAALSLILCISGKAVAKRTGKGKALSVAGIVINSVILAAMLALAVYLIIGFRSSSQI